MVKCFGVKLCYMRLFSFETILIGSVLAFSALMLWVLFGAGAKIVGDKAGVVIVV